jgi:hydroxymethylpyrimidine pyrophosphatase-like HAD family hydrolase
VRPLYRLLALDLDGTLLRRDKSVSRRNEEAIGAARRAGVRVVLATGRRYPSTRPIAERLGEDIPLVLHNGGLIVEGREVVRCLPLARDVAVLVIRLGREAGAEPVVHCGHGGEGKLLVERMPPNEPALAMYLRKAHADVRVVSDVLEALPGEDPIQVMFGGPIDRMDALLAALSSGVEASAPFASGGVARLERTVYPESGVEIIDVLSPRVGKAEAVRFVCSRFGLTPADALAIGDNWNDAQMLLEAGRGLVMGNADEGLHRLGLEVLPSNDEDGVAVGIDRHLFAE